MVKCRKFVIFSLITFNVVFFLLFLFKRSEWNEIQKIQQYNEQPVLQPSHVEKAIIALTPQNILFGTDSGRLTMRHDVTLRQKGIFEDLVTRRRITKEDR
ncbi:MAG: hypothetical protein ACFFAJ_07625 [Candidatus Hodarchaeota archaeon]